MKRMLDTLEFIDEDANQEEPYVRFLYKDDIPKGRFVVQYQSIADPESRHDLSSYKKALQPSIDEGLKFHQCDVWHEQQPELYEIKNGSVKKPSLGENAVRDQCRQDIQALRIGCAHNSGFRTTLKNAIRALIFRGDESLITETEGKELIKKVMEIGDKITELDQAIRFLGRVEPLENSLATHRKVIDELYQMSKYIIGLLDRGISMGQDKYVQMIVGPPGNIHDPNFELLI